jgi:hypothetical protein
MTILKQPFIEKNIKGKPYITVSPKGIANGLSDIPNDGADFGPDTMLNATNPSQIGPPYTQTSGLAEAVYYQYSQKPKKILTLPGTYYLYAQVPLHATVDIEGTGTYINGGGTVFQLMVDMPGKDVMPFSINGIYRIHLNNIYFNGNGHTANSWLNFYLGLSASQEGSHLNYLENLFSGENGSTSNFNWDFILDNMEDTVCWNIHANKGISWQANGGAIQFYSGYVRTFQIGAQIALINGTVIGDKIILAGTTAPSNTTLNNVYFNYPSSSPFYIASTTSQQITCNSCWINNNQNKGSPYPMFALQSGTSSGTVMANFNSTFFSIINQGSSFVSYNMFGTGITGYGIVNNSKAYGGITDAWADWQNWLMDYRPRKGPGIGSAFSITTPAVPTSGTAITNTNPYPVDIYITNAGSVSSYQINNLTISAGLSVGQVITLAPGWSLTLTYTTAPTWTWAYHA